MLNQSRNSNEVFASSDLGANLRNSNLYSTQAAATKNITSPTNIHYADAPTPQPTMAGEMSSAIQNLEECIGRAFAIGGMLWGPSPQSIEASPAATFHCHMDQALRLNDLSNRLLAILGDINQRL